MERVNMVNIVYFLQGKGVVRKFFPKKTDEKKVNPSRTPISCSRSSQVHQMVIFANYGIETITTRLIFMNKLIKNSELVNIV